MQLRAAGVRKAARLGSIWFALTSVMPCKVMQQVTWDTCILQAPAHLYVIRYGGYG